jgi:hypothetical protein
MGPIGPVIGDVAAPTATPTAPPVADGRHIVLTRLAQIEAADAIGLEAGLDQCAARAVNVVLKLETSCDDHRHGQVLLDREVSMRPR